MTTRAFQKIYTKIDNITKATVTLRATGVGNDELATVGGKLAQVVKIMGENVTLQIFAGTEGLSTDSEVVFHGEPPKLRVSDNLAGRFFNAYGEPLEGGEIIEGEAREIGGPTVNPFRRIQPSELIATGIAGIDLNNTIVTVMSVSSTSTFSPLSTAKYSAAVKAMSGTSRRSTGGFSVVLTNETMRSSAPAFSNTCLK